MGGYIIGDGGGWSILDMGGTGAHGGGEMALMTLDGGGSPPSPPILANPVHLPQGNYTLAPML